MNPSEAAVVLLSGGQDSTTAFYAALREYPRVEAVSFDYNQRHRVELELAASHAERNNVPWTLLPVEALARLGAASLTNPDIGNTTAGAAATEGWHAEHGLPPSFVPGRNLLFFTLAAAYAIPRGIKTIVTGVCATDRAGYPDCRAEFVEAMEDTIRIGMDEPDFYVRAPLLQKTKAETWKLADTLGVLEEIVFNTNTCYEGDRSAPVKPWGYGCGECGACTERRNGYEEFRQRTPARV